MRPTIISVMGAFVAGLALACGGSGDEGAPGTPTSTPTSSVTASRTALALRDIDFSGPPFAGDLITRAGGGDVPRERVTYRDLTGDGVEEAVVVVESGGTLGDIGVGIFRVAGTAIDLAYFRKLGGRVDLRGSTLVLIEGAPAPGDAACCPAQLRETTIEWRGNAFEVTSERLVANPASSGGLPGY